MANEITDIANVLGGNKDVQLSISLDNPTLIKLALILLIVFGIAWVIIKATS